MVKPAASLFFISGVSRLPQRAASTVGLMLLATVSLAAPVPGYVPPVVQQYANEYVDDTRGVYVPAHSQQRMKSEEEFAHWQLEAQQSRPFYAQNTPKGDGYEAALNTVSEGVADTQAELNRIAGDPGLLNGGRMAADAPLYAEDVPANHYAQNNMVGDVEPAGGPKKKDLSQYPSLANGGMAGAVDNAPINDGGRQIAVGSGRATSGLDMQNGLVSLKEERISVRRALQRMMDQIGGSNWGVVWDLDEQNAGLPDMEISIYAEEPFMNVLNSLLARLQSRSGQPLRVVRYDKTQRLVITDRNASEDRASGSVGVGGKKPAGYDAAVTERTLKETVVSLHYDEVPLTDALENLVNQAGKGQWRLRMYAGSDQVLKPAHIEEPFGVALERVLRVFNLKYEIFPGGKLIVVTAGDNFGFRGAE